MRDFKDIYAGAMKFENNSYRVYRDSLVRVNTKFKHIRFNKKASLFLGIEYNDYFEVRYYSYENILAFKKIYNNFHLGYKFDCKVKTLSYDNFVLRITTLVNVTLDKNRDYQGLYKIKKIQHPEMGDCYAIDFNKKIKER